MTHIVHKELSYLVRGVLFEVHNELGPMLPELFYQEAVSICDERLPNLLRQKQKAFTWQPMPGLADNMYPELTNELLHVLHRVHFELGPGFLHQVYRRATMVELRQQGLGYEHIQKMPIFFKGEYLGQQETRLLCVQDQVMLATIAVKEVSEAMKVQFRARMRRQGISVGLLANFNKTKLDVMLVRASKGDNNELEK